MTIDKVFLSAQELGVDMYGAEYSTDGARMVALLEAANEVTENEVYVVCDASTVNDYLTNPLELEAEEGAFQGVASSDLFDKTVSTTEGSPRDRAMQTLSSPSYDEPVMFVLDAELLSNDISYDAFTFADRHKPSDAIKRIIGFDMTHYES